MRGSARRVGGGIISLYFQIGQVELFFDKATDQAGGALRTVRAFLAPSIKHLVVYAAILLAGACGFHQFYTAKQDAQLKAIFESLLSESGTAGSRRFMENRVDLRPAKKKPAAKSGAKK